MYSPFLYNESVYGGTEYMARNFLNKIYSNLPKLENYLCLILPGAGLPLSEIIKDCRKIILWLHNTPTQFNLGVYKFYFSNPKFWEQVKYIVVPSETAKHYLLRDVPNVNPNIITKGSWEDTLQKQEEWQMIVTYKKDGTKEIEGKIKND